MSKHTFGPWTVKAHDVLDAKSNTVATICQANRWNTTAGMVSEEMPWEANARLIAAAPEMLRLIQRLTSPHMAEMEYRMDAFIDAAELINQLNSDD